MSNQFGKRLFNTFFKSYTEKVWGMSCKEISADWAAQRIKGLSLGSAIKNALFPQRQPKDKQQGHQDTDQFLPLSAQRPRHDVGSVRGKDQGHGRPDRDGLQRSPAALTTRATETWHRRRIRINTAVSRRSRPSMSFHPRRCASWSVDFTPAVSRQRAASRR